MKKKTRFRLFAVCAPGLEEILSDELSSLGIQGKKTTGGVEFSGDLMTLYSTNLWLRTASRILVRIGTFPLSKLDKARKRFSRYPWEIYLGQSEMVRIRASCHKSRIYHTGALSQRLVQGISDRLGKKIRLVSEERGKRSPLVFVRVVKDQCVLSVDSSGEHLHKRGFKKLSVRAPLRENLAAAMLIASGYDGSMPLFDPFCGSGTICLEAAMIAARVPPGKRRTFAFMKWKGFDRGLWNEVVSHSEGFFVMPRFPIIGFDKDEAAINSSISNAVAGGLDQLVTFEQKDFATIDPKAYACSRGLVVTNPPYGKRLKENHGLLSFYKEFGQLFKKRFPAWDISLIIPSNAPMLRKSLNLHLRHLARFSHGGLSVELLSSIAKKG